MNCFKHLISFHLDNSWKWVKVYTLVNYANDSPKWKNSFVSMYEVLSHIFPLTHIWDPFSILRSWSTMLHYCSGSTMVVPPLSIWGQGNGWHLGLQLKYLFSGVKLALQGGITCWMNLKSATNCLNLIPLREWMWCHNASLHMHQHFNCSCIKSRIYFLTNWQHHSWSGKSLANWITLLCLNSEWTKKLNILL